MKSLLGVVLLLALVVPQTLLAQATDFQMGKILSVEKRESASPAGGTDARTAPNRERHNLTIQVNDQLYVCRAETMAEASTDWMQGKEVPVKVQGKTLLVKRANGKIVKLPILSTKKAD
jgi:hypothetical protein